MILKSKRNQRGEYGQAVLEFSLLAPWVLFLFVAILDFGFYDYAVIAVQNAARVAAAQTSRDTLTQTNSTLACRYALTELDTLPNTGTLTTCAALPVVVTAKAVVDADGYQASQVSVQYQTVSMIPIPGVMGRLTLTRTAQMRVRQQ